VIYWTNAEILSLRESAVHSSEQASSEKCEKYRDTRGCEWAIISS